MEAACEKLGESSKKNESDQNSGEDHELNIVLNKDDGTGTLNQKGDIGNTSKQGTLQTAPQNTGGANLGRAPIADQNQNRVPCDYCGLFNHLTKD